MRTMVAAAVACLSVVGLSVASDVQAFTKRDVSIPAGGLGPALQALSAEGSIHVVFISEDVNKLSTKGASGSLTIDEALNKLLNGTGLTFQYIDDETVSIVPLATTPATTRATGTFSQEFRLAQAETPSRTPRQATAENSSENSPERTTLEEIVVTAQKREERLQDVPVPVGVVTSDVLVSNNQLLIQDYYTRFPAINLTPNVQSSQTLSIRGITTGSGNPTVGVMVDDVPYGSSTNNGGGRVVPDIDPGQLQRIEVLRGPQGTLYGASSMGGLLKFVTTDPTSDRVKGSLQAGVSSVKNGGQGYNLRAAINLPVSDTVAVGISGFTRQDPGYIENPLLGLKEINEATVNGGRLAALWRPSDVFFVKLNAILQKSEGEGSSVVDIAVGDLLQNRVRDSGIFERESQIYTATLDAKFGQAEVVSVTGYNVNSFADNFDNTLGQGAAAQTQFGVSGALQTNDNETRKFSQEVRFTTPLGAKFDALTGVYYSEEKSRYTVQQLAANPTTGVVAGRITNIFFPSRYEDYAVFGDLTYKATERFDIQVGARGSQINIDYRLNQVSNVGAPFVQNPIHVESDVITYLLTPRFKINSDLMVYARAASGYRSGGPNPVNAALTAALANLVPTLYEPDKTYNYEIGLKGAFLDRRLTIDTSVYYIDWKDIQLNAFHPIAGTGYTANGGGAKSQGAEFSAEFRSASGTTLAGWVAFNESTIDEPLPIDSTIAAPPGTVLPNSPKWTGNVSLDQEFPLSDRVDGFVGASVAYVGSRIGVLRNIATPPAPRQNFSSYTKTDVRGGARFDTWEVSAYVNNLSDERGQLNGGLGTSIPNSFLYIQPRTFGVLLSKTF